MNSNTKECYIKPKYYEKAYSLGARWNPETCKWIIDANNKDFKPLIKPNKPINKRLQYDYPELHLDDRRRSEVNISQVSNSIHNIFLTPTKYMINGNNAFMIEFIYYRANCMCELCYVPIKEVGKVNIAYEERCKVYRCVCSDCAKLVNMSLTLPIIPAVFDKFLELSGLSREELEKKLVDMFNE